MSSATVQSVIDRIRAFKRTAGLSHAELARRAGLAGHTTLLGMDDAGWNPRSDTLRKLEAIIPPDFRVGDSEVEPVVPSAVDRTTPAERGAAVKVVAAANGELTQVIDEARPAGE